MGFLEGSGGSFLGGSWHRTDAAEDIFGDVPKTQVFTAF